MEEGKDKNKQPNPLERSTQPIYVALTAFGWHELLCELEQRMRIPNVDRTTAKWLYENIASQLAGKQVTATIHKDEG